MDGVDAVLCNVILLTAAKEEERFLLEMAFGLVW